MSNDGSRLETLGRLIPNAVRELLRGRSLRLARPVWGERHGRHASRRAGSGHDFRDHRNYVPGDDLRRIDWRAVARRDRLVLRQTESEDELPIVLLVDHGGAMAYGETSQGQSQSQNKRTYADALAGALAWLALRQGDAAGLAVGAAAQFEGSGARPQRGWDRMQTIARTLLEGECSGVTPWLELLDHVVPRLPRHALLIILSDLLDPVPQSSDDEAALWQRLAQVRARGHDVLLLQVLHRDEVEFPWTGRKTLRFDDARNVRESLEAPGAYVREAYLERLGHYLSELDRRCERDGIHLHRIITDTPLTTALVDVLGRLVGAPAAQTQVEAP